LHPPEEEAIPYQDSMQSRSKLEEAAVKALEQSLGRFTDVLYSKHIKKQEKKMRKKKLKEQMNNAGI
jgi:hypothetical protein